MILRLSLDLPEDESYLQVTRLLGRTLLEYLKVVPEDVQNTEIVIQELCTNVLRHAHSSDGRYEVVLEYYAERVVVTVHDHGEGFSFRDVLPVGAPRPDLDGEVRVGGFGLMLVQGLAKHLELRRADAAGMTVTAELPLHYADPADAQAALQQDHGEGSTVTLGGPG